MMNEYNDMLLIYPDTIAYITLVSFVKMPGRIH